MKNYFVLILIVSSSIFAQNGKSNYFENKIQNVSYQNWTAGVQGGGSGTGFTIEFKEKLPENIILEQLYFKKRKTKVTLYKDLKYMASFINKPHLNQDGSIIEYDSQPMQVEIKYPFPIQDNEAILEYTCKNQKRYFKVKNVKEIPALEYPSARPRN